MIAYKRRIADTLLQDALRTAGAVQMSDPSGAARRPPPSRSRVAGASAAAMHLNPSSSPRPRRPS